MWVAATNGWEAPCRARELSVWATVRLPSTRLCRCRSRASFTVQPLFGLGFAGSDRRSLLAVDPDLCDPAACWRSAACAFRSTRCLRDCRVACRRSIWSSPRVGYGVGYVSVPLRTDRATESLAKYLVERTSANPWNMCELWNTAWHGRGQGFDSLKTPQNTPGHRPGAPWFPRGRPHRRGRRTADSTASRKSAGVVDGDRVDEQSDVESPVVRQCGRIAPGARHGTHRHDVAGEAGPGDVQRERRATQVRHHEVDPARRRTGRLRDHRRGEQVGDARTPALMPPPDAIDSRPAASRTRMSSTRSASGIGTRRPARESG